MSKNDWLNNRVHDVESVYNIKVENVSNKGNWHHGFFRIESPYIDVVEKTLRDLDH